MTSVLPSFDLWDPLPAQIVRRVLATQLQLNHSSPCTAQNYFLGAGRCNGVHADDVGELVAVHITSTTPRRHIIEAVVRVISHAVRTDCRHALVRFALFLDERSEEHTSELQS